MSAPSTPWLPDDWFLPPLGARLRQTVAAGPFVVQLREDMGAGSCRLTRHTRARETTFRLLRWEERSEVGMPCHVAIVMDERDGAEYVIECGFMGPGLPCDAFAPAEGRLSGTS